MSVYNYKCPSCGAPLTYNPNSDKQSCEYCLSEFTKDEIEKLLFLNPEENKEQTNHNHDNYDREEHEKLKIKGYNCDNCGAEVVTDDSTLTTFCYFCHSPVVLRDRASGNFKPDKVIPFKFDKESAKNEFMNWVKTKKYIKSDFYSNSQLDKITGMYLPYWASDIDFEVEIGGEGYTYNIYRIGDIEYTDKNIFEVYREGSVKVNNIYSLAYNKINSDLLTAITPFYLNEAKDFTPFYLNGYFSEMFQLTKEDVKTQIDEIAMEHIEEIVEQQFGNYADYEIMSENIDEKNRIWKYYLLPVWIMTYYYNDDMYIFAMNGQTKEIYGNVPLNKKKMVLHSFFVSLVTFVVVLLVVMFLW